MKPELCKEVELIFSVPAAELEVGDRAILIEYLEHPDGGEMGAVLELSQSRSREHFVVTVPVGAIASTASGATAALDATVHDEARSQEAPVHVPMQVSFWRRLLNMFTKFAVDG